MAVQELHLFVKAFGDAVVASEAPHGGDLGGPGVQGVFKLDQLGQTGLAQPVDSSEQARHPGLALLAAAMFLQQQVAEALLKAVDQLQGGVLSQIGQQMVVDEAA